MAIFSLVSVSVMKISLLESQTIQLFTRSTGGSNGEFGMEINSFK